MAADRSSTMAQIGAAVIGTGFMGVAHTEALRRLGVTVVGAVGSSPERARAKAATALLPPVYDNVEALVGDPAVDVVHVTSPNHVHAEHVRLAIDAGKHVVCEKPLGVSAGETADLVARAAAAGVVNAVCFNLRHYPQNQHAAALVAAGVIGQPWLVTGRYHQDWLLLETDWNWRLDSARQGGLRAVADIGSHWLDLARFITGRRVVEVFADLHTFVPERKRPLGEVETFAAAGVGDDVERVRQRMESDDAAGLLLRLDGGTRGACSVSQVSAGRKNVLEWELAASESSLAWAAMEPERLWIGHRGRPNELFDKDPALMTGRGAAAAAYPPGHVEGYPDTFRALFAAVYGDVVAGGPAGATAYPTFADGHDAVAVGEAIVNSARSGSWASVEREHTTAAGSDHRNEARSST